ncbi:hypothetical protein BDQ17DRAFT_1334481 [Cyathus striatus]|nr:hypothetical protein BDQ17DRAFT_1334481 [Cyathus striatus]
MTTTLQIPIPTASSNATPTTRTKTMPKPQNEEAATRVVHGRSCDRRCIARGARMTVDSARPPGSAPDSHNRVEEEDKMDVEGGVWQEGGSVVRIGQYLYPTFQRPNRPSSPYARLPQRTPTPPPHPLVHMMTVPLPSPSYPYSRRRHHWHKGVNGLSPSPPYLFPSTLLPVFHAVVTAAFTAAGVSCHISLY